MTHPAIPIAPGIVARVTGPMPPLPAACAAAVDAAWARALAGGPLFNGPVFSADCIAPAAIEGHVTEYRRVIAQAARIDLGPARARPLAVVGVVLCPDGVVFGRRRPDAATFPGQWQTPPAGSVDAGAIGPDGTVDLASALYAELREELGVPRDAIVGARPLCVIEHRVSHIADLGTLLHTRLTAAELRAAHAAGGDDEYASIEIVPVADLAAFLATAPGGIVASTPGFLRHAGLLAAAS